MYVRVCAGVKPQNHEIINFLKPRYCARPRSIVRGYNQLEMSSPSKIPRPIKPVVVLGSTNGRGGEKKTEKKEARDKIRVEKVASPKSTSGASETKNCPPRSPRSSLTQPLRPHPQTRDERKGSRDERKGRDDRKGTASKETVQRSTSASCSRSASKGLGLNMFNARVNHLKMRTLSDLFFSGYFF